MKALFYSFLLCIVVFSCKETSPSKAEKIIQACVETHGGSHYQNFDISFDFRKFHCRIAQQNEKFSYERSTSDSLGNVITDKLTNAGFERTINGKKQSLSAADEDKYREATNSIAYFVLLPYKLLDKAVHLDYLGEIEINGAKYDKIKVWFDAEGGGKDHDDVFCYWINQQTKTLDFLAYDNGGPRFRKATLRQVVDGITFQDYDNYKIRDTTLATWQYDMAFLANKAELLSRIEQTNYKAN